MKLKFKLLIGFSLVLAILLGTEVYNILFLRSTNNKLKEIVDKQFNSQQNLQNANLNVLQMHADIWDTMLFNIDKKEEMAEQLKKNTLSFYRLVEKIAEEHPDDTELSNQLKTLSRSYNFYGTSILKFENLDDFKTNMLIVDQFKDNKLQLITIIGKILDSSSVKLEESLEELKQTFRIAVTLIAVIAVIAVILGLAIAYIISGRVTRPIKLLMKLIGEVESDNYDAQVEVISKDELGKLSKSFNNMITRVKISRQKLGETTRLQKEMEIAEQLQTSLLPPIPEHPDFEIAALMNPADEVGGDYYDIVIDKNNRTWFAIGDVSGHGLNSGLIMMMAQSSFVTTVNTAVSGPKSPGDTLMNVNELLYLNTKKRLGKKNFMTMTFFRYDGDGKFIHAGAHLDIVIYRDKTKKFDIIETKGIYLGLKSDISKITFESKFDLHENDILFLYSDGIIEVKNDKGKLLDMEGFIDIISNHITKDVHAIRDNIIHDTLAWCNNKRDDDMTLMVIKRKGAGAGKNWETS